MKIVIASDSYKGSCPTMEVANSIERGFRRIYKDLDVVKIPVADGGEGTVDALVLGTNGKYEKVEVIGPLGEMINAAYGIIYGEIAIIEMAAASGLALIKQEKLNPLITTTYGTGQLIKSAMEKGIRKIYVGLGGSSTNDGGVGMAQALGVSFKEETGNEVSFGGGELSKIKEIDFTSIHPLLNETEIIAISDVTNPLCGPTGASYVFGPQKGADKDMVRILDENLRHLGGLLSKYMKKDILNIPGTGAAGGLGAGMIAFCNANIVPGIEMILDIAKIDYHLKDADLVITGEGKIDEQTKYGKVPVGVAKRAMKNDVPVIAIVGSVGKGASETYSLGIDLIIDIVNKPMTLDEAIQNASLLIEDAAENVARAYRLQERALSRHIKCLR